MCVTFPLFLKCPEHLTHTSATALFYIKDVDENISPSYPVHTVDLGAPIIDFAHHSQLEGSIYVTCDPNRGIPQPHEGPHRRNVRLLRWSDGVGVGAFLVACQVVNVPISTSSLPKPIMMKGALELC